MNLRARFQHVEEVDYPLVQIAVSQDRVRPEVHVLPQAPGISWAERAMTVVPASLICVVNDCTYCRPTHPSSQRRSQACGCVSGHHADLILAWPYSVWDSLDSLAWPCSVSDSTALLMGLACVQLSSLRLRLCGCLSRKMWKHSMWSCLRTVTRPSMASISGTGTLPTDPSMTRDPR